SAHVYAPAAEATVDREGHLRIWNGDPVIEILVERDGRRVVSIQPVIQHQRFPLRELARALLRLPEL
ncbi:MAG: hypothetical protein ACYCV7_03485, partial [Acidimicrobiales bacterium]